MSPKSQPADLVQPRRPRGRPKAEDLAELEERLLSVGRQLFFKHGYGAMTMSELASAARVSKTTLYSRFPSKAALFREIVARQMAAWDDDGVHHTPIEHLDTLEAMLAAYADVVLRAGASEDFIQTTRLIFAESGRFAELGEIAGARFARGVGYVAGLIRRFGAHDGVACDDPEGAAEFFLSMVAGRSSQAMMANEPPMTADARGAWTRKMVRAFMSGLIAR